MGGVCRQIAFFYGIYVGTCCADIPRAKFVSFPTRVVVDAAFVEKAVEAHGPDKKAAVCKLVSEQYKMTAEFYKSTMNFEFHVEGRIIGPDEPGAPGVLTKNCKGRTWQTRTSSLFSAYMKKLGGGDISVLLSGCKGRGMASPRGGACAKSSTYTIVPWGNGRKFEWFILAHELGHTVRMPDYKQGGQYIRGFMMGQTYSCCTQKGCSCKPFTESQKTRACKAIKQGGEACAKTTSTPLTCSGDPTEPPTTTAPTDTSPTATTDTSSPGTTDTSSPGTSTKPPDVPDSSDTSTPTIAVIVVAVLIVCGLIACVIRYKTSAAESHVPVSAPPRRRHGRSGSIRYGRNRRTKGNGRRRK